MLIKTAVIIVITSTMLFSVWKTTVGLAVPLLCLWGYGFYEGYKVLTLGNLLVISLVHIIIMAVVWWFSGKYRQATLAFTGAGITGFATGVLASMFFGALLGFFTWWGVIGRLVARPVSVGIKSIARSFMAGLFKVIYSLIMSGIISYMIFRKG